MAGTVTEIATATVGISPLLLARIKKAQPLRLFPFQPANPGSAPRLSGLAHLLIRHDDV